MPMGARRAVKTIRKALLLAALHLLSLCLVLSQEHTGGGPRLAGPRRLATAREDSRRERWCTTLLAPCKALGMPAESCLLGLYRPHSGPRRDKASQRTLSELLQRAAVRPYDSRSSISTCRPQPAGAATPPPTQTQKDARRHDPPTQGNTALG